MVMGGPYFSPFLLNVIYAHAGRHISDNDPLYVWVGRGGILEEGETPPHPRIGSGKSTHSHRPRFTDPWRETMCRW